MMIIVIIIIMIMMITKSIKFGHLCVDLWEDMPVLISDMSGEHHFAGGQRPYVHLIDHNEKNPWETLFTSCKANIPGNFWRMNCLRRVTSTFPGIVWSRMRQEALGRGCHFKRRSGRFSQYTWQEAHRSRSGWLCRAWTWLGQCSYCIQLQSVFVQKCWMYSSLVYSSHYPQVRADDSQWHRSEEWLLRQSDAGPPYLLTSVKLTFLVNTEAAG